MGFWGGELFANDHAADVRDELVLGLQEAIGANAEQIAANRAALSQDAQAFLVLVDTGIIAPAALLAALLDDPVVRALGPDAGEVRHWRAVVAQAYLAIRAAEERADTRAPSNLVNVLPGQAASGAFWRVREQETATVFDRLAKSAAAQGDGEESGGDA